MSTRCSARSTITTLWQRTSCSRGRCSSHWGGERCGISRELVIALALLLPFVIVVSGSREGALALVVAAGFLARIRLRLPTLRVALLLATAVVAFGSVYTTTTTLDKATRGQLGNRWSVIFNPDTYSPTAGRKLSPQFALPGGGARLAALTGAGLRSWQCGRSAKCPRRYESLYEIPAGVEAIKFRYIFDGNWGLLITETGFLGLAAVTLLLAAMWRVGIRAIDEPCGLVVYCLIPCVVVLGFFECVMQDASSTLVLWVFTGLAIAAASRPAHGSETPA